MALPTILNANTCLVDGFYQRSVNILPEIKKWGGGHGLHFVTRAYLLCEIAYCNMKAKVDNLLHQLWH